ncbi:MAG TPA: hypothetical protein DEA45_00190 [Acholeplasmataceae bacterium]|nr:hypothetical protein [Acholeplasmataceae bacterium]
MMDTLEKNQRLNALYSIYQDLLTEKQRLYFNAYYLDDYSLQEVATLFQVSRNAVFDQLKKTEEHLVKFEDVLKLNEQKEKRKAYLTSYFETKDMDYLIKLKEMDEI